MSDKPIALHQFTPSLGYGDAISNYVIDLMKLFRAWGYDSNIYVEGSMPRVSKYCHPYQTYKPHPGDILIYHYGSASEITNFLLHWLDRVVIVYHNITPHHFYEFEDPHIYKILQQARADLKHLSAAPYAIGDSDYNCQELRAVGFKQVQVIPYFLNLSILDKFSGSETEQEILQKFNDGYVNLLFIGRLVPNKRQDDLIRLLAYYQQFIDRKVRLLLIGWESYGYKAMLQLLAQELGVNEDVYFIGHLELKDGFAAYYKAASVFVSMSEHEGFGVPLIESMYFDLPVVAYASSAVPEIMGEAGILVTEKRYDVIAEVINLIVTDAAFRQQIIAKQRERLAYFDRAKTECLIRNWVLQVQEQFVNKGLG